MRHPSVKILTSALLLLGLWVILDFGTGNNGRADLFSEDVTELLDEIQDLDEQEDHWTTVSTNFPYAQRTRNLGCSEHKRIIASSLEKDPDRLFLVYCCLKLDC